MKIGDVVKLKGSDVLMVIYDIEGSALGCIWFNTNREPLTGIFIKEILESA